jgi:hypothetical protein
METKAEQFLAENWPSINRGLLEKAIETEALEIKKQIHILHKLQSADFTQDENAFRKYRAIDSYVKRRMNFLSIVESTLKVLTITAYEMLCFEVLDWYLYRDLQKEAMQLRNQNEDLKQRLSFRESECAQWEKMYFELRRGVGNEVGS